MQIATPRLLVTGKYAVSAAQERALLKAHEQHPAKKIWTEIRAAHPNELATTLRLKFPAEYEAKEAALVAVQARIMGRA